MEQASHPTTAADLSTELAPAAHAYGVPKVEAPSVDEPARPGATWPKTLATTLVIIATSLYLLEQLQLVLRPLLIAVLLCYLIVPAYFRLRKWMRPIFSFLLIILTLIVGFQAVSRMIFSDLTWINRNLPRYQQRAGELSDQARNMFEPFLPPSLLPERQKDADSSSQAKTSLEKSLGESGGAKDASAAVSELDDSATGKKPQPKSDLTKRPTDVPARTTEPAVEKAQVRSRHEEIPPSTDSAGSTLSRSRPESDEVSEKGIDGTPEIKLEPSTAMVPPPRPMPNESPTWDLTRRVISLVASAIANFLLESLVVAFYMVFLLQEAGRFGDRIRTSFSREHATQIEMVAASINRAITDYLSVKVKASLIVAIPTALTVYAFGITGAATWGVLAFFGNFLPYIGGLVATLLPITLAYLEFDSLLYPTLFAAVLLGISGVTSNLIEPAMTGKALDLSPIVVMIGLAFWSLLWGLVGMCLAIPLTVVLKIILEHTPATRPIARLLGESQRPG